MIHNDNKYPDDFQPGAIGSIVSPLCDGYDLHMLHVLQEIDPTLNPLDVNIYEYNRGAMVAGDPETCLLPDGVDQVSIDKVTAAKYEFMCRMRGPRLLGSLTRGTRCLELAARLWERSRYWLFAADGVLYVMSLGSNGERVYTKNGGVDPAHIRGKINLPVDGGDWD